jgi:hypothetical protein
MAILFVGMGWVLRKKQRASACFKKAFALIMRQKNRS